MYGRFIGNYNLKSIREFLFPKSVEKMELDKYLPEGNSYLFKNAREAINSCLQNIKKYNPNANYVALPAWGCPIVLAAVEKAGFVPLLFDVSEKTLQMDIKEIIDAKDKYEIAAVILVSENGILYSEEDVKRIKKSDIKIISDNALAWQNFEKLKNLSPYCDYIVFSGGFSKPVSGLGLGVLVTKESIDIDYESPQKNLVSNTIKILIHILLQNRFFYKLLEKFIPKDLQKEYDGVLHRHSDASLVVTIQSLKERDRFKEEWLGLQSEIIKLVKNSNSKSPSLMYADFQQNKILIEKKLINFGVKEIGFHQQYGYDLLSDSRIEKGSKGYESTKKIRENFLSIAINLAAVKDSTNFLNALKKSLLNN